MAVPTVEAPGGLADLEQPQAAASAPTEVEATEPESSDNAASHGHSESMVTVRLSSSENKEDSSPQAESDEHLDTQDRSSKSSHHNSIPLGSDAEPIDVQEDVDLEKEPEEITQPEIEASASDAAEQVPGLDQIDRQPGPEEHHEDAELEQHGESAEEQQGSEASEEAAEDESSDTLPSPVSTVELRDDDSTLHAVDSASQLTLGSELEQASARPRNRTNGSSQSSGSEQVDWAKLDKNEEQEERDETTDESTAFLLARLEQENAALAIDPKSSLVSKHDSKDRPPSIQQIKKLVLEPSKSTLRYSKLPSPPPMTELEFWSALVRNYPQTAQRLPTLTANKIRSGIPPPLRGVVWMSIAGARDTTLEDTYDKLCQESSPYERLIHKDIGRSFPGVDMFRDPGGEGQQMLGKVLNAFSLYDQEIGYCQGLGFVVGPLLMHMGDKEAFCTLVRLMDHYDLRSCFLPNLTGLHLRIYQFQQLLSQHLPELTAHLDKLCVEPLYISQWFLSFFGVTCPLPMLIRLYDVILTEGASETLMRVALSLMRRNEKKIMAATEFEDVMQLLLSRALWDTYNYNADELISDFCNWTGLVTRDSLKALEVAFKESQSPSTISKPSVHTAAQRFLGRLWNGSGAGALISPKSPPSASPLAPPRPSSALHRTPSKQSMASTLNSIEGSEFSHATASTDATGMTRQFSAEFAGQKPATASRVAPNKDRDLHGQIEDLLTALSNTQREHSLLSDQLQREREERDEDRLVVARAMEHLRSQMAPSAIPEGEQTEPSEEETASSSTEKTISALEAHFATNTRRGSLVLQTKQQLREELARWKTKCSEEASRASDLSHQLSEKDRELVAAKDDVRDARSRVQGAHKEKQRLEKANQDLRAKRPALDTSRLGSVSDSPGSVGGLRELKLGQSPTQTNLQPQWSKRASSLSTYSVPPDDEPKQERPAEDSLLLELANAKTAEAVAKQELEEVKRKLESFRKLLSGKTDSISSLPSNGISSKASGHSYTSSTSKVPETDKEKPAVSPSAAAATATAVGGFFSGWGKRAVSHG